MVELKYQYIMIMEPFG